MGDTKELKRLLEENVDDLFDVDCELAGPCYEVKIDPDDDRFTLILDGHRVAVQSVKALGFGGEVPMKFITDLLATWRAGDIKGVSQMLGTDITKGERA